MANDHPFQMLFETLGRIPTAHAESVNRHAYEILCDILTVPVEKNGRCILLRAPRAGHGKTHLLSRIQHYLGSTHEFIPLHPAFGCRIDAVSVTDDALRRLVRPLPASGGLCVLDLVTRRLFATALQPLVGSGEVPCQDREGALSALRTRPIETFDFHHPNAVTAHWARENFEVLGQRLSMELANRCSLPIREVAFWVEALFRFAATPIENSGRVRALAESVHSGNPADGESMERLEALLGLLSLLMRVVLVADDLEGFSADETAALRLASFLGSLRQSVERLDVILSLNQDIWQSAFLPRLSGGLADRLSEVVIELNPLSESEMVALLESRVPGLGSRVLEKIDVSETGTHARGLIRAAGMAWLKATATDSAPSSPAVAAPAVEIPTVPAPAEAPTPAAQESERSPSEAPAAVASAADEPVSWPAPEFSPAPPAEVTAEPVAPAESTPPPLDSPIQVTPPVFIPEPTTSFTPPNWQQAPAPAAQPTVGQPEVDSPFQIAQPAVTPEPPAGAAPASGGQASPEPGVAAPSQPAEPTPPPAAADTDRVDDLLRQFRERYGRGSL
ncbi:MAG: hypothetical protein ABI162_18035 [Luteolibacter sp.]